MRLKIIEEAALRREIGISSDVLAVIEEGFVALSSGEAEMPPIMRVDIPEHDGEVDVKTAYIRGKKRFAIKISSGFFQNYRRGLPNAGGMMIVVSAETGVPEAVLLDNGYLTTVRTAAAGAIAARYLAPDASTAGVIGTGLQARWQILALQTVRPFERLFVYGRSPEHVERYTEDMRPLLPGVVVKASNLEALVRQSDVVITTTPSQAPLVKAEWLHPGLHVTAMGSDAEYKQELEPEVLAGADLLVCDSRPQCFRLGEVHHAAARGLLSPEHEPAELGEVIAGRRPKRTSADQITVCDLTGTGVQDTAIATFALGKMEATAQIGQ